MSNPEEIARERLREIQNRYTVRLRENLTLICDGVQNLLLSGWDRAQAGRIAETAHQSAGSAPTFGFEEEGLYCRLLETLLKGVIAAGQEPNEGVLGELRELHKFLVRGLAGLGTGELPLLPTDRGKATTDQKTGRGVFLLASGDGASTQFIEQLTFFGHPPEVFYTPAELEGALAARTPAVLLAEIEFSREPRADLLNIIRWRQESPRPLPVIFISDRDDFEARLQAVHAGGFAFFHRPLDIHSMNALVDRLDELTGETQGEGLRVLIVDDDRVLGEYYALVLERAGVATRYTGELERFIEHVAEFQPDLVLMDLYLDGTLGTDLALVLGQHARFRHLPVIFLSGERNRDLQIQTLEAGADNFLIKPINPGHLVLALRSRARRSRFQQDMARRDGLTALFNHVQIKEELERALERYDDCLAVMVDIDFFKAINDNHGHAAGDQVIRSLARTLKARFRGPGSVGRYGGEEFLLVLPETSVDQGFAQIEELREEFGNISFPGEGRAFKATFSSGLAAATQAGAPAALLELADQALYRAKTEGRNRTVRA